MSDREKVNGRKCMGIDDGSEGAMKTTRVSLHMEPLNSQEEHDAACYDGLGGVTVKMYKDRGLVEITFNPEASDDVKLSSVLAFTSLEGVVGNIVCQRFICKTEGDDMGLQVSNMKMVHDLKNEIKIKELENFLIFEERHKFLFRARLYFDFQKEVEEKTVWYVIEEY